MDNLSFLSRSFRAHLFVEDPRTLNYFSELFANESNWIEMFCAGGCDGVNGIVNASWEREAQPCLQAIGWQDSDFGSDNMDRWGDHVNPIHVFRGKCHEIENYLLDWVALKDCKTTNKHVKTDADYCGIAFQKASSMLYDVVCADVMADLQNDYTRGFPKTPSGLASREAVESFFNGNDWFANRSQEISVKFAEARIADMITNAETKYKTALNSSTGDWRFEFPGKEIFKHVVQTVFGNCGLIPELVHSIAEYQRENNAIPDVLRQFLDELKYRDAHGLLHR